LSPENQSNRRNQILVVVAMLPPGLAMVWITGAELLDMFRDLRAAADVVIVNRLVILGSGASIVMIGAALLVVAADFLGSRQLTAWATRIFFGGAAAMFLFPLPVSVYAGRVLSSRGYVECPMLAMPSFKLSRTAWTRDSATCERLTRDNAGAANVGADSPYSQRSLPGSTSQPGR